MWMILGLFAPILWAGLVPGLIKSWHMWRQHRLLDRCWEFFIMAEQSLLHGDRAAASEMLVRIARIEARWRIRNHALYRTALGLAAIAIGMCGYGILRLVLLDLSAGHAVSFQDFGRILANGSNLGASLAMFSSFWAIASYFGRWSDPGQIENWSERLRQMLNSGSGLEAAAAKPAADRAETLTAWQIFGVEPYCSRAQLKRARRRLAQRYHPDKWAGASPAEQRAASEAMKRVNAMFDELKVQL